VNRTDKICGDDVKHDPADTFFADRLRRNATCRRGQRLEHVPPEAVAMREKLTPLYRRDCHPADAPHA
jgi:hypothetical protein